MISRLTLAWSGAAGAAVLMGGVFAYLEFSGASEERVSLAVGALETMARAEAPANTPSDQVTAPVLRDPPQAGDDTVDILDYPAEFPVTAEAPEPLYAKGDDIRITIIGGASPVQQAALTPITPRARPIADPRAELLEASKFGAVPRRGPRGEKALDAYAHIPNGPASRPAVSLMVGGLGLNPSLTERVIDTLPAEISLSFAPYAKDLPFWTEKARKAGHEVLIELPMEGYGERHASLGAAGLMTGRTPEQNLERLDWLMSRFSGYVGATNYMGAKFSADSQSLTPVLERLRQAGLGYIDDTGAANAAIGRARPGFAATDRIIPAATGADAAAVVRRELAALEAHATREGASLGKTYAYATTIDEIIAWTQTLEEKGVSLAPASVHLRGGAPTR